MSIAFVIVLAVIVVAMLVAAYKTHAYNKREEDAGEASFKEKDHS